MSATSRRTVVVHLDNNRRWTATLVHQDGSQAPLGGTYDNAVKAQLDALRVWGTRVQQVLANCSLDLALKEL